MMPHQKLPEWTDGLRNLYWHLRYVRKYDDAARRRYYRKIEAEKERALGRGVDPEVVRLFCRWMASPENRKAEERFWSYPKTGSTSHVPALETVV